MTSDTEAINRPRDDATMEAPENTIRSSRYRRIWASPVVGVGFGLLALIAVFTIISPSKFATVDNARNVLADASVLVVIAMPTTFILICGELDLSVGSIIAFGEVIAVKSMIAVGGGGIGTCIFGLLCAVVAGGAWGALNGFLVGRVGLPSFIVTLATLGAALGAAQLLTNGNDIAQVPTGLVADVGVGTIAGISVLTWIAAAIVIVAIWTLGNTRFGRYTYATGSDAVASERAGINVSRHVIKIYTLGGLAYGLAAYLNVARFSTTTVGGHAPDALNAIAAVALGGTSLFGGVGSAAGSVLGVFIPSVLSNGLVIASVQPYWQEIAIAVALLGAIYADQLRRRTRRR